MTLGEFYALVAAFVTLAVLIVVVPIIVARNTKDKDALTNTQLVKGRLKEIEREVDEGLLNKEDKVSAENEVKLALVEEQREDKSLSKTSMLAIAIGAVLAISIGVWVYINVNHMTGVQETAMAPQNLQSLSAKLLDPEAAATIQPEDIQQLALAIRLRLKEQPDDAQGWMFLGRLRSSLGQLEEAIASYERSLLIRPDNVMTRISYAQALMMTSQEENLQKAQRELSKLLLVDPDNDNLVLMMAVTSVQLGDANLAQTYYSKVKDKLDPNNPMRQSLDARLAELGVGATGNTQEEHKSLNITIDIAESLQNRLPDTGFLVVFARNGEASQGMPIAVKRQSFSGFPTTLTLGDSDAMVPEMTLSKFDAVNLTARVSTTPDVGSQAGDLEGTLIIESIASGPNDYAIEINKEIQ